MECDSPLALSLHHFNETGSSTLGVDHNAQCSVIENETNKFNLGPDPNLVRPTHFTISPPAVLVEK
jgi:hypothetical protein